jgi:hypothetical protein
MTTPWTQNPSNQALELPRDATLRLGRGGIVVRAQRGTVLVTQAGDRDDHVLEAGDELLVPRGGLAVAWALTAAELRVVPARTAGEELVACAA